MQLVGRPFGLPRVRHRGFVFTVGVGRENRNQSAPSHFQPRLGMKPAIGPLGPPLSSDSQRSVLVVDDDPDMCWILKVTIEMLGRSVTTAQSGRGALDVAHKFVFPLAFIDARLPDMDGPTSDEDGEPVHHDENHHYFGLLFGGRYLHR